MLISAHNRRIAEPLHQLNRINQELENYPMGMTKETYAELTARKKALEVELEEIRHMSPAQVLTLKEYEKYLSLDGGDDDAA